MRQRDLDAEDKVRELQGELERCRILLGSHEFQWFLGLLDGEIARVHTRMEVADDAVEVYRLAGEVRGYRMAANLLSKRVDLLKHELVSRGA